MAADDQGRRTARCSCGGLTATVRGEPVHTYVCSCLACQRRSGSAFTYGSLFPEDAVEIAGPRRSWRTNADSGRWIETSFCPTCGVTVYYHAEVLPRLVGIPAGCFAEPGFAAPREHYYSTRRHDWLVMPDGIAGFAEGNG